MGAGSPEGERGEDEVTHLRWRLGRERISGCREARATGFLGQAPRLVGAPNGRIGALSVEICSGN